MPSVRLLNELKDLMGGATGRRISNSKQRNTPSPATCENLWSVLRCITSVSIDLPVTFLRTRTYAARSMLTLSLSRGGGNGTPVERRLLRTSHDSAPKNIKIHSSPCIFSSNVPFLVQLTAPCRHCAIATTLIHAQSGRYPSPCLLEASQHASIRPGVLWRARVTRTSASVPSRHLRQPVASGRSVPTA